MTSYKSIFERFCFKIKDYVLLNLDDSDVFEACRVWMDAAIPKIRRLTNDLSDRDNEIMAFNSDLTEIEQEVIANMMIAEWLEPQINSQNYTNQFYGGKEEKFFAQSTHLNTLMNLKKEKRIETNKLIRSSKYNDFADQQNTEEDNG